MRDAIRQGVIPGPRMFVVTRALDVTGAYPLLWTTELMCPEAYTLETALAGWVNHESPTLIHEQASRMYSRYQHCSVRAAGRLLHTGL